LASTVPRNPLFGPGVAGSPRAREGEFEVLRVLQLDLRVW
jgi:hypothetical protein